MNEIRFWKAVFSLLALALALYFFWHVADVLMPFLLGLVISYLIHPLVDRLVAVGFRRDRIVIVLYVLFLGSMAALSFFVVSALGREIHEAIEKLPTYTSGFNTLVDRINDQIRELLHHLLGKKAPTFVLPFRADHFVETILNKLPENAANFAHIGLWIFIVPFVCFFSLSQGRQWLDLLFDWTPSGYVESLLGLLAEVNATLGGYIRGQLLDATCVGLLTSVGLYALGFDGAVLLGVLTGLMNMIPFMAPIVGGSLALLIGYFQGLALSTLFGIFCLFILVRLLDDFIFMPFVVGSSVHLHPLVMLFAILAGFHVGGILGLVFAVPAAAIIKVILSITLHNRKDSMMLEHTHIIS